mmetsp:Transcript_124973/g.347942  ORF Transcript_124973/g.347942 Transcript_124973/m.347942 type:complete len:324 (-) Transcript_124973:430-1401(-)
MQWGLSHGLARVRHRELEVQSVRQPRHVQRHVRGEHGLQHGHKVLPALQVKPVKEGADWVDNLRPLCRGALIVSGSTVPEVIEAEDEVECAAAQEPRLQRAACRKPRGTLGPAEPRDAVLDVRACADLCHPVADLAAQNPGIHEGLRALLRQAQEDLRGEPRDDENHDDRASLRPDHLEGVPLHEQLPQLIPHVLRNPHVLRKGLLHVQILEQVPQAPVEVSDRNAHLRGQDAEREGGPHPGGHEVQYLLRGGFMRPVSIFVGDDGHPVQDAARLLELPHGLQVHCRDEEDLLALLQGLPPLRQALVVVRAVGAGRVTDGHHE